MNQQCTCWLTGGTYNHDCPVHKSPRSDPAGAGDGEGRGLHDNMTIAELRRWIVEEAERKEGK